MLQCEESAFNKQELTVAFRDNLTCWRTLQMLNQVRLIHNDYNFFSIKILNLFSKMKTRTVFSGRIPPQLSVNKR